MKLKALKAAFPNTIPILTAYFFLGFAYGIYMNASGFAFYYPLITSIFIFGGSLEFVACEMLLSPFAPVAVFFMALLIQARHIFYGLSMLEKYKGMGWKKIYLIYGLSDETFSLNYVAKIPEDVDKGWYYFFVTLLDQCYWIIGCVTGGLIGGVLPFSVEGISFVMTAMFVVIFLEQILKNKKNISPYIGLVISLICLLIFKQDNFLIPSMILILVTLLILKKPIEKLDKKVEEIPPDLKNKEDISSPPLENKEDEV